MKDASFFWIIISIISFVVELLTPTFFFLSIAFAGIFAWLISFVADSIIIQILTFLVFFIIFFYFIKPVLYKGNKEKFNSALFIGKVVYAKEDITEKSGSVSLDGSIWQARSESGLIDKGSKVVINKMDGNKFIVTKEVE